MTTENKIKLPSEEWEKIRDEKIREIRRPSSESYRPGQLLTMIREEMPLQQIHLDVEKVGYDPATDELIIQFPESSYKRKGGKNEL